MKRDRCHPLICMGLVLALLGQAGCAGGPRIVPRADLSRQGETGDFRVTTRDGSVLEFISLVDEGESLAGTVRMTTTRMVGEGETARPVVANRYEQRRIPWSEVDRIESAERGRVGQTWYYMVGAIVAGVAAFLLFSGDDPPQPEGGGGKEF